MATSSSRSPKDAVQLMAPTVVLPKGLMPEPTICGISRRTFDVIVLGLIFLLTFSAFNPAQSYQSTANKEVGQTGLGVLYLSFAIAGFVSPVIVHALTPKWSMMLGATTYVFYMGSNIRVIPELLYTAAGACGVGASILWTAQGAYLAKNSDKDTLGRNSGIFFGIFQINMIVGYLVGGVLRTLNQPYWILFTAFTSVGALGALSFVVLRQTPQAPTGYTAVATGYESGGSIDEPVVEERVSIGRKFINTLKLLVSGKFLLLAPIIIYSGLSQAFFFGVFTKMVSSYSDSMTGFVFATFGACDVLGSFLFGKLLDIVGRKPIFFVGGLFTLGGTMVLLFLDRSIFFANPFIYFIVGSAFGLSDAAMNTCIYGSIGNVFGDDVENGFGAFRLLQSSTTAAHYFAQAYLDKVPYIGIAIVDGSLLLGWMAILILDFCVARIDPVKEERKSINHDY